MTSEGGRLTWGGGEGLRPWGNILLWQPVAGGGGGRIGSLYSPQEQSAKSAVTLVFTMDIGF